MAAESAWKLGGLSVVQLGKRVWKEVDRDEVLNRAASLAYYFVLALFPMLLFVVSMMGLMASKGGELQQEMMQYISRVAPGSATGLIQQTLQEIIQNTGGAKLSFGIVAALWSASAGVIALMDGLNAVYNVPESRGFIRRRLIAIGLTIGLSVLIISALVIVLFGGPIADKVGAMVHLSGVITTLWKIVQWPVAIGFLLLAFASVYYLAPDIKDHRWQWVTPGALAGVVLWLLASLGVKIYLSYFDSYSKTYGSLGGAIVLLIWLYISGAMLLLGGEVNSEIENAAAEHGDPEAKAKGEKVPGERPEQRRPEKRPAA